MPRDLKCAAVIRNDFGTTQDVVVDCFEEEKGEKLRRQALEAQHKRLVDQQKGKTEMDETGDMDETSDGDETVESYAVR